MSWSAASFTRALALHGSSAVLAAFLAGCATPEPQPIDPVRSEAEFRARTLGEGEIFKNIGTQLNRGPDGEWDLDALTMAAFFYHPDLDLARARLGVAQAATTTAGAIPNPTFGADLEKVLGSGGPPSPWVYGFSLNLPLDFLWKRGYRVEAAGYSASAARLELSEVGWRVRSRLRAALADHLLALLELEGRRFEEAVREEVAKALEARLAVGEIFRLDVDAARAELASARAGTHAAEGRVSESRAIVASRIGVPGSALAGIRLAWPELEKPPAEDALPLPSVVAAGLVNRLDIRRTLAEYAASEALLGLELAKRYPDVSLGPGYLWDQGDKKFAVGLSVSLPVFNQNGGPIAEAEARRKEVAARFLALQAQAIGETEAASARYRSALAELGEAEKALAAARRRETSVRRGVELGEMDRIALTGVRMELSAARAGRLAAIRRAHAALGDLEDTVQRPLGPGSPPLDPGTGEPRRKEKP